ncbi:uncharacterized protein LOC111376484 [Olea europaea var. sylvestris]|uniref:uncharacterized protein LOC111376484 n=1 Tax=Olea europaea var. sylvestris TaxID=158386 RepID=UPI000C1D8200|nr:uncharacterized protein LOC111376484 [Olea europaea var. sylvestris]
MAEFEIRGLHIQLDESQRACTAMIETATIIPDLQDEMEALRAQLRVLQRPVGNGQAPVPEYAPRLRIPEPCTYGGARDAKEIENFLFDMEQYFLAASIEDEVRKDKLFTFMEGLKPWTRTEFQRQKVTDLSTAMGAAECLSDYQTDSRKDRPSGSNQAIGGGNRSYRPSSNPNGGEHYSQNREGAYQSTRDFQGNYPNSRQGNFNGSNSNNWNKGKLASDGSSSKQEIPQANCHNETDSEEDEEVVGAFSHRCNTLSHRVAKKDDLPLKEAKMEEAKARICRAKGLMYIDVKVNGKPIRAMVDTGATHNYLAYTEVERLGLVLEKGSGKVGRMGEKSISAMQFSKGFKRNEPSFLCTLRLEEIEEANGPIPKPVKRLIQEFENIMPEELPKKLPPRRTIDHEIELIPGAKLLAGAPYRMSQPELEELRKQLGEMLESGIIVPAKSPYEAPVLFQKKADGSLRMCCDYRALNKIIVKNSYPIPLVVDCFDRLSRAKYYTKVDLRSGYWLKKFMWTNPILALPDMAKPFEIHTDASDFALGGVLMQEGHPVAYESRKLNQTERRYSAHEKELLAVVHCIKGWRHYLLGSPFIVKIDNTVVSHFMSQPKLSSKQARCQKFLSEFNFIRRTDLAVICSVAALSGSAVSTNTREQIRALMEKDPTTQYLVDLIKQGKT